MKSVTRATLLFAGLSLVSAHGTVQSFTANGVEYYAPRSNEVVDSPVRMVTDVSPSKIDSPDMACGPSAAKTAALTAKVTAGSTIEFTWRSGDPSQNWVHQKGPVMTYMGKCSGAAADCAGEGMQWFKIDEQGFLPNGDWTQTNYNRNESTSAVVPAGIANGDYLIRHEIIALHNLPAEFYVSCTQVTVDGGSSDGAMKVGGANLAAFPGAYSAGDKGVTTDVFSNFQPDAYVFPGPPLFKSAAVGGDQGAANPAEAPSSTGDAPAAPTQTKTGCSRKVKRVPQRLARSRLARHF